MHKIMSLVCCLHHFSPDSTHQDSPDEIRKSDSVLGIVHGDTRSVSKQYIEGIQSHIPPHALLVFETGLSLFAPKTSTTLCLNADHYATRWIAQLRFSVQKNVHLETAHDAQKESLWIRGTGAFESKDDVKKNLTLWDITSKCLGAITLKEAPLHLPLKVVEYKRFPNDPIENQFTEYTLMSMAMAFRMYELKSRYPNQPIVLVCGKAHDEQVALYMDRPDKLYRHFVASWTHFSEARKLLGCEEGSCTDDMLTIQHPITSLAITPHDIVTFVTQNSDIF